jgi:hypothetical protein
MAGTSRVNREVYARVCGRLEVKSLRPTRRTHALESVNWLSELWRGSFRACVYAVAVVSGASVTASSCFGIGIPSFFSNAVSSPAIFVR